MFNLPVLILVAFNINRLLGGEKAPDEWQGGLNITYHLGPGFSDNYTDW